MAKLDWGRGIGLHFKNNNEYYETLGFLTKRSRLVDIYTRDLLQFCWAIRSPGVWRSGADPGRIRGNPQT